MQHLMHIYQFLCHYQKKEGGGGRGGGEREEKKKILFFSPQKPFELLLINVNWRFYFQSG